MGRKVDVDDLVGASDIAQRMGIRHSQNVHWWVAHDPQFPKPVAAIGTGRKTLVWLWADVEQWAIETDRWPVASPADSKIDVSEAEGSNDS